MKLHKLVFILLAALMLCSCYEDDTNRSYKELVKPELVNPDKDPSLFIPNHEYIIKRNSTLELSVQVKYHDMKDVAYEWVINGQVVSNEKSVKWLFNSDKRQYGYLAISRKSAGNADIYPFTIAQEIPFQRGFSVLAKKNGVMQMTFIQEVVKSPDYQYYAYNNAPVLDFAHTHPLKMVEYWSCESSSVIGEYLYVDQDPTKCLSFDGQSLVSKFSLQEEFMLGQLPDGLQVKDIMYGGYTSYVLSTDGKLYLRRRGKSNYTGRYFHDIPERFNGELLNVSKLIPAIKYSSGQCMLYEAEKGRFLLVDTKYTITGDEMVAQNSAGKLFEFPESAKMSNIKDKELVFCQHIKSNYTILYWALFKDQNSKYYARQFNFDFNDEITNFSDDYPSKYVEVDDIDQNSLISVVNDDNVPMVNVKWIYYTQAGNPNVLMVRERMGSSLGKASVVKDFGKKITSITLGKITRLQGVIALAFEDGDFMIHNFCSSSSPHYEEWDESKVLFSENFGDIVDVTYKYGTLF